MYYSVTMICGTVYLNVIILCASRTCLFSIWGLVHNSKAASTDSYVALPLMANHNDIIEPGAGKLEREKLKPVLDEEDLKPGSSAYWVSVLTIGLKHGKALLLVFARTTFFDLFSGTYTWSCHGHSGFLG